MDYQLPKFSQGRILVVGDVMLDRYWHGNTARISPEAPVPIVHIQNQELRPGGAANVALNIASLRSKVHLLGLTGTDEAGKNLCEQLQKFELPFNLTAIENQHTVTKLRVISLHQQLIRLDFETKFTESHSLELLEVFHHQLALCDVVVLSDYGKGTLINPQPFIQAARNANKIVLVDPKAKDLRLYQGATLVTPNRKEFEMMVGNFETDEELETLAHDAIERYQLQALLVTRGEKGMTLIEKDRPAITLPTRAREVYDVTGAGDTVIGTIAATLAAGDNLERAVRLANLAAGITVGKLGAATVTPSELALALQETTSRNLNKGIVTEEELLELVRAARAQGQRVVMTNGCFDILHAGHISYLNQARELGDRLIIAVNSDDSVRRLKGETRPINLLWNRLTVLTGLEAVDWVVPFVEDTPQRLISEVLPDVLVKGGDYQVTDIAGHKEVLAHGGEVIILPFLEGCSTSSILARAKKLSEEFEVS